MDESGEGALVEWTSVAAELDVVMDQPPTRRHAVTLPFSRRDTQHHHPTALPPLHNQKVRGELGMQNAP